MNIRENKYVRNFCIIAHIDHGKSTLADRMLDITNTIPKKEMREQVLDNMDLERERGITIKSHAIQMEYVYKNDKYFLNLIDTPGHVDFTYEVSRSLAACEGAILLIDASQGIEAQTLSNLYLAMENNLAIIPVINKIDLPGAQIEGTKNQIKELLDIEDEDILLISAKTGKSIDAVFEKVINGFPSPESSSDNTLRALIFDSEFDPYRGVISYIRVFEGEIKENTKVKFFSTGKTFEVSEIGVFRLKKIPGKILTAGDVGYLICGAKNLKDTKVGDTITHADNPAERPLPGYKEPKPMVFAGLYPAISEDFEELRDSIEKLKLNDAALFYEPESSKAVGFGFRCGFLGLLHMEIIQERLEREYGLNLITTVPNVEFKVTLKNGTQIFVDNPAKMPDPQNIVSIEEPYISSQIITPTEYIGNIMKLCMDRRGIAEKTEYISEKRVVLKYRFPLSEIIFDFYDKLKSISRGYASFDYEHSGNEKGDLVKLDILLNGDTVDALSYIIYREKAYFWGKKLCNKLRELIPRQLFEVVIQAAIGNKIIARDTIKALRKNVTAKCYGGDITRKRKLLEKQKEGKKRMKKVGNVEIPQEAFMVILGMGK